MAVARQVGPWGCPAVLLHTIGCGQVEWGMVVLFVSAVGSTVRGGVVGMYWFVGSFFWVVVRGLVVSLFLRVVF